MPVIDWIQLGNIIIAAIISLIFGSIIGGYISYRYQAKLRELERERDMRDVLIQELLAKPNNPREQSIWKSIISRKRPPERPVLHESFVGLENISEKSKSLFQRLTTPFRRFFDRFRKGPKSEDLEDSIDDINRAIEDLPDDLMWYLEKNVFTKKRIVIGIGLWILVQLIVGVIAGGIINLFIKNSRLIRNSVNRN